MKGNVEFLVQRCASQSIHLASVPRLFFKHNASNAQQRVICVKRERRRQSTLSRISTPHNLTYSGDLDLGPSLMCLLCPNGLICSVNYELIHLRKGFQIKTRDDRTDPRLPILHFIVNRSKTLYTENNHHMHIIIYDQHVICYIFYV